MLKRGLFFRVGGSKLFINSFFLRARIVVFVLLGVWGSARQERASNLTDTDDDRCYVATTSPRGERRWPM